MKGKIGLEEHFAIDDTLIRFEGRSFPTTSGSRCATASWTSTAAGCA